VSAYQLVAKAYRRAQIEAVEMRYNPMKRMRENVHTLEAIILATTQGLERASMHYNVATGIILSMGRDLSLENNWKIAEAACAWHSRGALHGAHGVVGLDVAGPESGRKEFYDTWLKEVAAMFEKARSVGLGTTYHIGETDHTGVEGIERVLDTVQPDRIGHGIALRKADDSTFDRVASKLRERSVLLEICPSVNLITRSIGALDELAAFLRRLRAAEVPFSLNTDNPYLIHTNLKREYDLMAEALGGDAALLESCHAHARQASFLQGS
jgi:adenosine deaminase